MQDWRFDAACAKNLDVQLALTQRVDLFADMRQDSMHTSRMKQICNKCAVREQCLNRAMELLATGERNLYPWGIWGGTTEKERRALLRLRRKTEAKALQIAERLREQFQDKSGPIAS